MERGIEGSLLNLKRVARDLLDSLRDGIAHFIVDRVWLPPSGSRDGELYCDWKAARKSYPNDRLLLRRAFALAYAGAVVNSQYEPIDLGRIMNDLPSDVEAISDIRQTAVNWGLVTSTSDTRSLSDEGYALAQRLVEENQDLIYLHCQFHAYSPLKCCIDRINQILGFPYPYVAGQRSICDQ